jgi:hypothetical protein
MELKITCSPKPKNSDDLSETRSQSSTSTPEPVAPIHLTKNILSETMKGIREVASFSYESVKEWALSPEAPPVLEDSPNAGKKLDKQSEAARQAISDLLSPFMACHTGLVYQSGNDNHKRKVHPSNRVKSIEKDKNLKELRNRIDALRNHENDGDTIFTLDTATEDELLQLHRLASWETNGTNDTLETEAPTVDSKALVDDDGRVIPAVLIETAQKRREKRIRPRLVRFDYPPITSLRECPRPNPEDLPDLFFTEEELDEIEADRSSSICVDDIEIVAVASVRSGDSSTATTTTVASITAGTSSNSPKAGDGSGGGHGSPDKEATMPSITTNSSTTVLAQGSPRFRRPRPSSPYPQRATSSAVAAMESPNNSNIASTTTTPQNVGRSQASRNSSEETRLIKGVQIYLRERSTGKCSNKR